MRIFGEQVGDFAVASRPVPRDEGYARGELVLLHKPQQFIKVQVPVSAGEQRVVDYQASAGFLGLPTNIRESPFDVEHDRQRSRNVITNVEDAGR